MARHVHAGPGHLLGEKGIRMTLHACDDDIDAVNDDDDDDGDVLCDSNIESMFGIVRMEKVTFKSKS